MNNQQKIAQAKEKIEELKNLIESLEKGEENDVWVPEKDSPWWFVDADGGVKKFNWWGGDEQDMGHLSIGNVFKTKEEAEMHKLRLQSMAQRGRMPAEEEVWYWDFRVERPVEGIFDEDFLADYWMGNVKKTKEECEAWYEKFGEVWGSLGGREMNNKIQHKQKFYIIHREGFTYHYDELMKKETGEKSKFVSYMDILEVYVHSKNKYWDGVTRFNISPVNPDTLDKSTDYWRWRAEYGVEDIGSILFNTKEEAMHEFNRKFSKKEIEKFNKLKELRFLHEN